MLLDGGWLTDQRTGAAGGVAARRLAPERVDAVAVIGTGAQARKQVEALRVARPSLGDDPRLGTRSRRRRRRRRRDVGGRAVAASVEEAVRGADVVVTCTAAREPLVLDAWIEAGAHVTAVGSDGAGKQELDPAILRRADVLVVDSRDQCETARRAPARARAGGASGGARRRSAAGIAAGRTSEEQLTVCDLTGVGVQDVAAANAVLANVAADAGETIEL